MGKREINVKSLFMLTAGTFLLFFCLLKTPVQATPLAVYDTQFGCTTNTNANSKSVTSSNSSSKSTSTKSIPNTDNVKKIYDYMHNKYGFSGAFIAGILGNWQKESSISPLSVEGHYGGGDEATAKSGTGGTQGIGLAQWTAGRHTKLVRYAKSHNQKWYDLNTQLDFMFQDDGAFPAILKKMALDSSATDPVANAIAFHSQYEISADSTASIRKGRGGMASKIFSYLKANNMNGSMDKNKVNTISGKNTASASASTSPTTVGNTNSNQCSQGTGTTSGSTKGIGKSVKANGKAGKVIGGPWSTSSLPSKYKKAITLPSFKAPDYSGSPYSPGAEGQCTEFTYYYMAQLHGKKQPSQGNGNQVWQSYKKAGAKITNNPTVGYGFSADAPHAGATSSAGHTGVVVAVFGDGSYLTENFNVSPYSAPGRKPVFLLLDGASGQGLHFFSGVKGSSK